MKAKQKHTIISYVIAAILILFIPISNGLFETGDLVQISFYTVCAIFGLTIFMYFMNLILERYKKIEQVNEKNNVE